MLIVSIRYSRLLNFANKKILLSKRKKRLNKLAHLYKHWLVIFMGIKWRTDDLVKPVTILFFDRLFSFYN